MKKQVFVITLAAALGVVLAGAAYAQMLAAPAAPAAAKIGIINIQRAIVESEEGKKAAERLQTQFGPKRKELEGRQAEIERLQKQLRDQEKTLSEEARTNLLRQVESKTKEFTRTNEDATNDFQQAEGQVINEIGSKVMRVIDDYARKNGYHMILDVSSPQGPVLWASTTVDVTDEIIKLFNAQGPVAAPAPAAGSGAAGGGAAGAGTGAAKPAAKPAQPGTPAPAAKKPAGTPPR